MAAAAQAAARAADELAAIAERRARIAELLAPVRAARIAAGIVERGGGAGEAAWLVAGDAEARRLERFTRTIRDDAAWLVARSQLAPEIAGWPELDPRFAQHEGTGDAIAALDRALAEHTESRAKLERSHKLAAGEVRAAAHKHDEAKRKAATYAQKRGITLEVARRQEDQARTHLAEVERLVAVAGRARAATATREAIDDELARLAAAASREAARATALGEAQRVAQAVRAEQARVVDELRRAAGYVHARAELVDGEPCPLCGAEDHPWRDRGALDDVIAAAAARLEATRGELDAIASELAAISARDPQRAGDGARLTAQRAAAIAEAATAGSAWRDQLGALGELLLAGDPGAPEAEALAADRHASARKALEDARTMRSQTEAATKAAQDAQAEVQLCQLAVEQLTGQLAELDRRRAELDASLGRLRGERASKLDHHAALAGELAAAIARWSAALPADDASPDPGRGAHRAVRAAAPDPGGAIDPALAIALVGRLQASAPARAARDAVPGSPLAIVRLAMAAVVTTWRERAERSAEADAMLAAAMAAIEREAREADRAVAEHTARRGDAERRRGELAREHAAAQARLTEALSEAGFELAALGRLLSSDPSRVDALAERLAVLERAVDRARAVVIEREHQIADHAAIRPSSAGSPAGSPDDALAGGALVEPVAGGVNVEALAAEVAGAERLAAQRSATLAADAEARARRASALAQVAADETGAEVDRILGDVIGSHDGKLFRSFAQSLTLDGLLAVANAHLEELAPRYQLERVPRHDLELQVIDRDLGSEIRSVQSLSGGESFLVSLALALGLSSMSAHDVRVRTLLIDEGFGTLDPATLDSALSVLDALQATGRQVGVISHVPALVERVGAHVRVVQRGGGRSEVIVA
jgi:exonuclease SbcC